MCPVCVGRKKIFGVKATGSNSFHRCGGPPPSKREVFGMENRASAECRRARDARPYNVAGNCNCEMCLQRWVASLQRLDAFATDGFIVISRRGAHRAPVYPRCYNNPSRGRAKGHRGDRKAPISNRRQGRKALTGEVPRPPSSREGDRPAGGGRSERRSARPRGLGGDFEFLPLKSPRNPITPIETSRVATLHPGLYKRLREDARRVIGATAKPLYAIDGKAEGLDRRSPKTSLFEGGGPPAGGGRSSQRWKEFVPHALKGVRARRPLEKAIFKLHMLHMHHMPDTYQAYDVFFYFFELLRPFFANTAL